MKPVPAALRDLLATEHQALYAYGVLGARLADPERATALSALHGHQAARDALTGLLRATDGAVPGPALAYEIEVGTRAEALALAVRVETDLGVRWRDLVGLTDDVPLRRLAVQQLSDTAV
ncbi:MAG: ferritin-like domain-containing protein, partial [Mycobacteriales bacterium]